MKKLKFIGTIIFMLMLSLLFISTSFAGYAEVNTRNTEEVYNKIIHFTHDSTLTNTENENYIIATNFNDVQNNTTDYSVLLLDTDAMEEVDFDWIKSALQNNNIVVLVEYEDLQSEMTQKSTIINKTKLMESYNKNSTKLRNFQRDGYYKISLEANKLSYDNCIIKATNTTKLLRNVNMYLGKTYTGEIYNEKITTVTEASDITRTAVNHPLRFYWSSRTDVNKIYESVNKNGNILVNLYKGEVVYELGGEYIQSWTDEYGTKWTYWFTKVHGLTNTGSYTTGYMIVDGTNLHTDR